jgi:dihydrofolate synthase/folylpolyglutamate synthase
VPKAAIAQGIATAHIPGRMQRFEHDGVAIVLDVAHNPQAARELAQWLQANPIPGRTFAVFAALGDKDLHGVVAALAGHVDGWFLAGIDDAGLRGLAVADFVQRLAGTAAADGAGYATAREALPAALAQAAPGDRILVLGSFHTVAAALRLLQMQHR